MPLRRTLALSTTFGRAARRPPPDFHNYPSFSASFRLLPLFRSPVHDFRPSTVTPAMAAGVTERLWEIVDIVRLVEDAAPKPGPRGPYKKRNSD